MYTRQHDLASNLFLAPGEEAEDGDASQEPVPEPEPRPRIDFLREP
jgi:hypothetical protein